jgi:hypothetical protein
VIERHDSIKLAKLGEWDKQDTVIRLAVASASCEAMGWAPVVEGCKASAEKFQRETLFVCMLLEGVCSRERHEVTQVTKKKNLLGTG